MPRNRSIWRSGDLVIAVAAIATRLPFLLRADRFFDSDEAVEGLMARHLGDHSLFLWGQRYKGTPEVFLTGAAFRAFGSSVIALKAVTLACFVAFLCLNFRLIERVFSRRVAGIATAFFIAGPPALVLWTLSGSAEMVMTFLTGAALLLAVERLNHVQSQPQTAALKGPLDVACAALGFGLWVQQYIVYYIVALAITAEAVRPDWCAQMRAEFLARSPRWLRALLAMAAGVAAIYVVLGLVAFFTAGVDVRIAGVRITATHPQKMWWIAGALAVATVGIGVVATFRTAVIRPALAFLAGYLPAIIGRIGNHGLGAPISRLDFNGLVAALPDMNGVMLPMLLGFRDPLGRPTAFVPLVLVLLALVAVSFWHVYRRKLVPFFHVFVVIAPLLFLASGSYNDVQSYRYLMPIYAALPVVYALGIDAMWRTSLAAGLALLLLVAGIFAAQQTAWYRHLEPDVESARAIACLDSAGVRVARAGYWQSYKLTFLTGERIIVAPVDGIDRYAPYSEQARTAPTLESVSTSRRCS